MKIVFSILLSSFFFIHTIYAQRIDEVHKSRIKKIVIAESLLYLGTMTLLSTQWYDKEDRSNFHFFNDNRQWLQMDKAGHFFSAYQVGRIGMDAMRWGGLNNNKSIYYGGVLGLAFLSGVEVLDGFSTKWGFSWGDMLANTLGASMVIGQELAFGKQLALIKLSFHQSQFAPYRPDLLGSNIGQSILKDYNGQTYWLSLNLKAISKWSYLPDWLCFSFGYGASGMTGGRTNPEYNEAGHSLPEFNRQRQYYLSLDIDLEEVKTKSKFLKTAFKALNFIKIPLPTLRIQEGGELRFYPFYF